MYDLVVLGSGPAGQRAAVQAAKLKRKVLVVEKDEVGGGCLHQGTIPSKTLREAALNPHPGEKNPLKGVMDRVRTVIEGEAKVIREQLRRNSVEFAQGTGAFRSPHEVEIKKSDGTTQVVQAKFFVIATGTRPFRDPAFVFDDKVIFDSDSILKIARLPRSLLVLGAGVIGCEYASIFARLGVETTLMDRRTSLLRSIDEEIVAALEKHLQASQVSIKMGHYPDEARAEGPQVRYVCNGDVGHADAVLVCMGRVGNSAIGLEKAGLTANDRGIITVNSHYQTAVPHIYAVGDIIGPPALAASSAEQGRLASYHAFAESAETFPTSFPYGIYTIPEISTAGDQENDLKAKNIPYVVGRAFYRELARGKILGDDHGFLKLIVHKETHKLLGVHIIGSQATELIHIGQVAMSLGARVQFLVNNVFNYPTLAEAYKVAAYNAYNQLR